MTITVKAIVTEIERSMNKWENTHNVFSARQVIVLADTFGTLYVNGFFSENTYNKYKDYVNTCCVAVSQDYKTSKDGHYKKELKDNFRCYGLMENL